MKAQMPANSELKAPKVLAGPLLRGAHNNGETNGKCHDIHIHIHIYIYMSVFVCVYITSSQLSFDLPVSFRSGHYSIARLADVILRHPFDQGVLGVCGGVRGRKGRCLEKKVVVVELLGKSGLKVSLPAFLPMHSSDNIFRIQLLFVSDCSACSALTSCSIC